MKRFCALIMMGLLLMAGCTGSSEKKEGPVYGGTHSDTPVASNPSGTAPPALKLENNKPEVTNAELVSDGGSLRLVAQAQDKDGDPVQLRYAWVVNDQKVSDKPDFSDFKKGDKIVATVTPFDGKEEGEPRSFVRQLTNSPPQIIPGQPVYDDPTWTYQVKATDADGDTLAFSLKNAPSGMTIDPKTGLIHWNTSGVSGGKHKATVVVSDGKGGTTEYPIEVSLSEEQQ